MVFRVFSIELISNSDWPEDSYDPEYQGRQSVSDTNISIIILIVFVTFNDRRQAWMDEKG